MGDNEVAPPVPERDDQQLMRPTKPTPPTPEKDTVVVKAKQAVVDHWKVIVAVLVVLVVLFFLLAGSEKFNTSQVTDVLAKYNPLKLLRKK